VRQRARSARASPLFDIVRYARQFEACIERALARA
jgi:hypothetical protein